MASQPAPDKPALAINAGAKTRYMQSSSVISAHRNLMTSDVMRNALDYAFLAYQERVATTEPQMAAAGFFRLQGAREFIEQLVTLAENPVRIPTKDMDNLSHRV